MHNQEFFFNRSKRWLAPMLCYACIEAEIQEKAKKVERETPSEGVTPSENLSQYNNWLLFSLLFRRMKRSTPVHASDNSLLPPIFHTTKDLEAYTKTFSLAQSKFNKHPGFYWLY